MKTCADCFYFEKVPLEQAGMCYGNPPIPVVHPSGALASVRPPVKAESRECGRFIPHTVEGGSEIRFFPAKEDVDRN